MSKHYDTRVRHRDFQIGDLVLRKVMGAAKDPTQGKLGPNWEGPYRITSWHRKGTYHLETMDGRKLQHPSFSISARMRLALQGEDLLYKEKTCSARMRLALQG